MRVKTFMKDTTEALAMTGELLKEKQDLDKEVLKMIKYLDTRLSALEITVKHLEEKDG